MLNIPDNSQSAETLLKIGGSCSSRASWPYIYPSCILPDNKKTKNCSDSISSFCHCHCKVSAQPLWSLPIHLTRSSNEVDGHLVPFTPSLIYLGVYLDFCLTTKPHLHHLDAKTTQKLAILSAMAGSTWGVKTNDLRRHSVTLLCFGMVCIQWRPWV